MVLGLILCLKSQKLKPIKFSGEDIGFIESKFGEEVTLRAEELLESGEIRTEKESQNKWYLAVHDKNYHFQCQIELSGDKLVNYQCNCVHFKKDDFCVHLAAGIMYVRREKNQIDTLATMPKVVHVRRRSRKDSIQKILQNLKREDLSAFLFDILRKNSSLKLYTLSHFAEYLDRTEKEVLVDQSFPPLTRANEKITGARLKDFFMVSDELMVYFRNLIIHRNFTEAYELLFLLLKKSFYIKFHLTQENKGFERNHVQLLENYHEIIRMVEAPEYREHIHEELLQLLENSYIQASIRIEKSLWIMLYEDNAFRSRLEKVVNEHLTSRQHKDLGTHYFIRTLQLLLSGTLLRSKLISLLDPQDVYKITMNLLEHPKLEGGKLLLLDLYTAKTLNKTLALALLEHLQAYADSPQLSEKIISYFIRFEEPYFIRWADKYISGREAFIRRAEKSLASNDPGYAIAFYHQMREYDTSIDILGKYKSKEMLFRFGHLFPHEYNEALLEMYKSVCSNYLDEHFGPPSHDFTSRIYQHLGSNKQQEILDALVQFLRKNYPHREGIYI